MEFIEKIDNTVDTREFNYKNLINLFSRYFLKLSRLLHNLTASINLQSELISELENFSSINSV